MLMWTYYHFLQMLVMIPVMRVMIFFKIVLSGAMLAQIYCDMYLDKNPPRTSTTSGMGWLLETLNTPGECHTQLRMSNEIFEDLLGLLVERYGLKASYHMSTY